jgi:twitching motility protein PilT
MDLIDLLTAAVGAGASDIHLKLGQPPVIRLDGELEPMQGWAALGEHDLIEVLDNVTEISPRRRESFDEHGDLDIAFSHPTLPRFRVNGFRQRGATSFAFRVIPSVIPSFDELGLPSGVTRLAQEHRGLVLVTGPTGSGKTTTLASMLDQINRQRRQHIVTIEDPIEYEHLHRGCVIEQVEIGVDAPDFPTALRAAVRQAPDVIVVGEMRDPETMRIALAAGETGHLVLSTLHTTDIASTVSRIADSFPSERQNTIRQEMAMALAAVMTQTLLPRTGGGLVPAAELLMVGYGARQHIRRNALQHLHQEITITRRHGSFTFEESLARLVKDGLVEWRDAHARAAHVDEFEQLSPYVPPHP